MEKYLTTNGQAAVPMVTHVFFDGFSGAGIRLTADVVAGLRVWSPPA